MAQPQDGRRPIDELNAGYDALRVALEKDPLARKRTEIGVVTFGGTVQLAVPFTEGRDLQPQTFSAGGNTPMGEALDLGLDQLTARKQTYKDSALEYFRPWLFVITDGAPTDGPRFEAAAARLREAERNNGVAVFAVGVQGADMDTLAKLSDQRVPLMLKGLQFVEMFEWLSASMATVSDSRPGSSDSEVAQNEEEEQIPLESPAGWAHV
jgi:uncharacterized protein YegL